MKAVIMLVNLSFSTITSILVLAAVINGNYLNLKSPFFFFLILLPFASTPLFFPSGFDPSTSLSSSTASAAELSDSLDSSSSEKAPS